MKRYVPNFLTCLNLITGSLGCVAVVEGRTDLAIYYVIVAGIFDFFDGFAARLLKVHSAIGKELDSLADVVSFGLLPALFMYKLIDAYNPISVYMSFFGLAIVAFSALRLAKFNVDLRQSDKFIGLPVPANAIMITSIAVLPDNFQINAWTLVAIALISCYLLVSNITMIALKFKGFGWKGNELRYFLIVSSFALVVIFQLHAIPMIIPLYILVSVIGNFSSQADV